MLFRESFITDKGAEILARAAAGDGPIIWTRAATSNANTDSDSVAEMNALTDITKTAADSYTSSGVVTNAIVNDARTSVSIYSELTNEDYDGEARTFGAWAKIEGDEGDVLTIVARCGGATPTTINPASEGVVKAFVDFTLQISAEQAQAVAVGEGYYATAGALEDEQDAREALADRVVTTHSAGDETAGDAQTIHGEKTYDGQLKIASGGILECRGKIQFAYGGSLECGGSSTIVLQSGTLKGYENSAPSVNRISIHSTGITLYSSSGTTLFSVSGYSGIVTCTEIKTGVITGIDGEDMQEGEKLLDIKADEITLNAGAWVWLDVENDAGVHADNGDIVLQPATGKSVVLQGDGAFKGALNGLIPMFTRTGNLRDNPVGSIQLIFVEIRVDLGQDFPTLLEAGETVASGATYKLHGAFIYQASGGTIKGEPYVGFSLSGTYRLMSCVQFSSQYDSQPALAIKIAV